MSVLLAPLPAPPFFQEKSTEQVLKEMFAFAFSSLASFDPSVNPLWQVEVVVLRAASNSSASHLPGSGWTMLPCSLSSSRGHRTRFINGG